MDINTAFSDPQIEAAGVWVDYLDDSKIKIARLGNPAWQTKYDLLMRPFRDLERRGRLPVSKQTSLLCQSYIGTILLDWEGFERGKKKLPFNEDTAVELLLELIDFRNDVTNYAADAERFKREVDTDAEKNS